MALFTAIAVISSLILLFVLFSKWRYQYWSRKGVPQLQQPVLFFGDIKPVLTGSLAVQVHFLNLYKEAKAKGLKHIGFYSNLAADWMPLDLNIIKLILVKDFYHFRSHAFYSHENESISKHMFAMEGDEWKKRRTKLSPTFTTGKMKMMFDTIVEKSNTLKKVAGQCAENNEISIKEILARFGTDVIGSVAFGIECNCLENGDHKFRQIGKKSFEPALLQFILEELIPHKLLGNLGYRRIKRDVNHYFTTIVKESIKYRENNNVQRKDFMHLMLQMKNHSDETLQVTDDEIVSEAYLFYLAGFETSSSATSSALLELSHNELVQDKLRQEIYDVLEKNDNKLTYDLIMEMPYLDQVVHEALRKYPPVPFVPRKCTSTYKVPGLDLVIEKGTRVFIPAWGIQMDPEYYPNPEEFNPDNFSPENKAKRPDYTWMPFGEGPRICIGMRFGLMQSKMALITLLRNFKFSPHEKTQWPVKFDTGTAVLTVAGDMLLRIEKL